MNRASPHYIFLNLWLCTEVLTRWEVGPLKRKEVVEFQGLPREADF